MIVVCYLIQLYVFVIIARIALSWFPVDRESVWATVQDVLVTLTEPVLGPVRRILPRPRSIPLDLSPMVVIFAAIVLQSLLC